MSDEDSAGLPIPAEREGAQVPAGDSHRLRDSEIDLILKRAAQSDESPSLPRRYDLTVADLMVVASEVGLDPAAVRRAAAIQPIVNDGPLTWIPGAPTSSAAQATHIGALPSDRGTLARTAERVLSRSGTVTEDDADHWVWKEEHGVGRTTVTWTPGKITVEAERTGHYFLHWLGGLVGWAALSAALPVSLGPLAATLLFLVTPLPLWARAHRTTRGEVEQAVMELLRAVEESQNVE